MDKELFLSSLVGKLYKVLPLYEDGGSEVFLYLERLIAELNGAMYTFPELTEEENYISIVNNLNYILHCGCSLVECRRQTFDSISLAKKLRRGGNYGES